MAAAVSKNNKSFVLKNVDPVTIDDKYRFSIDFNLNKKIVPPNAVRLDDNSETHTKKTPAGKSSMMGSTIRVVHDGMETVPHIMDVPTSLMDQGSVPAALKNKEFVSVTFLDESKREHHCVSTMATHDEIGDTSILHCFWCRHPFPYRPISAPISYVPNRLHKQYHSEITHDTHILRENVDKIISDNAGGSTVMVALQKRDYYVSDGVFCSFNCSLAFIRSNKHDPIYRESETLLNKIYYDLFGLDNPPIHASPSWRLLRNYGGHLTIEDFRRNLFKVEYKPIHSTVLPVMKPMGFLFERQIRI